MYTLIFIIVKLTLKKRNSVSRNDKDINEIIDFIDFCRKKLSIQGNLNVVLVGQGSGDQGMSTGGFDMETHEILAREYGRSLVDILRSLAHELVHYRQKEVGKIKNGDDIPNIGGEIEDEANSICGQLVKMYVEEKDKRYLYTY